MRRKVVLAVLLFSSLLPLSAQVAPAVKISGLPIGVGGGFSDYFLDYGPGRRMLGASAWVDYDIWHGLGIQAEGTDIFADKPAEISRMNQKTIQGGAIYKYHSIFHIRPFAKGSIGTGKISFPSRNPFYTSDTFTVWSAGGGVEYDLWRNVYLRGDYEYQTWLNFQGRHELNPNGFTVGATYYLRGIHRHY